MVTEFENHQLNDIESKETEDSEEFYLGTNDAGYDADRHQVIVKLHQKTQEERKRYSDQVSKEREELEKDLYPDGRLPTNLEANPLDSLRRFPKKSEDDAKVKRVWSGRRIMHLSEEEREAHLRQVNKRAEKEQRLREIEWGEPKLRGLASSIAQIERDEREMRLRKSDAQELDEIFMQLEEDGNLPDIADGHTYQEVIVHSAERGPEFQGVVPEVGKRKAEEHTEEINSEIWVHTTNHLRQMIATGGIANQSWIRRNMPDYYQKMVDNSTSRGTKKDAKMVSPLQTIDTDKIFFSANRVDPVISMDNTIVYDPKDLMVDTGLYYLPTGAVHMGERVVSDVVDPKADRLPQDGSSDLMLSFDRAYIAVYKGEYADTARDLLLAGYSKDWVSKHLISYRGEGHDRKKGQQIAVKEIRRRIEERRKEEDKPKAYAIPNTECGKGYTDVYQVRSEQTVQFANVEAKESTETETGLSFTRAELEAILQKPDHTPDDVLMFLDKDFGENFDGDTGVKEKYDLRTHMRMVLTQKQKYFKDVEMPTGVDPKLFEVGLIFHDIEKPKAVAEGDKSKQHEYSVERTREILEELEYTQEEIALVTSLIDGDPIGEFLQFGGLDKSVEKFRKMQESSGLDKESFWQLLEMYYKIDSSSYTHDADPEGMGLLDYLYDSDSDNLDFSEATKMKVEELKTAIFSN